MPRISVIQTQPQFQLRIILAIVLLSLSALYFARYAIWGKKGFLELRKKEHQLMQINAQLATKKKENAILESYVNRLNPRSLDLDFLDERARETLNFARDDEIVLLEEEDTTHG